MRNTTVTHTYAAVGTPGTLVVEETDDSDVVAHTGDLEYLLSEAIGWTVDVGVLSGMTSVADVLSYLDTRYDGGLEEFVRNTNVADL